jgi:cell division septation protein DedD
MSRDQHPGERDDEPDADDYYDDQPRSIFAALWFRALLAVLVLGVLAAVAVPYMLDFATHSTSDTSAAKRPVAATTPAMTPPTAQPAAKAPVDPAPAPTAVPALTPAPSASAPAPTATPAPPAPAAMSTPAEPAKPSATTPATAQPARPAATVRPVTTAAKSADAMKPRPRGVASKTTDGAASGGPYWVQVGAFKDAESANRLVTRLREQGFRAEQVTSGKPAAPAAPAADAPASADARGDRYSVVVSGGAPGELDAKLAAKGMTSEATSGGAVVQPALPLREAVALSRELADAGLSVQVRRQGAPPTAAPATAAPARAGDAWYRVRVGGFPDRAAAVASLKKLEEKGYKPFIATSQ